MAEPPKPPKAYSEFSESFPKIREAWDLLGDAAQDGPLDEKTMRLIKLGVAMGAMREGAVHSSVRKARALGVTPEESATRNKTHGSTPRNSSPSGFGHARITSPQTRKASGAVR